MSQQTVKILFLPVATETQWEKDALSLTVQARLHPHEAMEAMQAHMRMQEELTQYCERRLKTMQWAAIVGWFIVLTINAVWLAEWLAN